MSNQQVHRIIFYPVSNGDTSQFILSNGKHLLFDFNHRLAGESEDSPHIDLKTQLKQELDDAGKDTIDVFALTHADKDHICGAADFFYLEYAKKYQEGERIKIETLWVPAVLLLEKFRRNEEHPEYAPWAEEAWHRLLEGKGVRIFSKPKELADQLAEELEKKGLKADARDDLFIDAGRTISDFTLDEDGIELFVHSPFADHQEDGSTVCRNEESLMFHIRFKIGDVITDMLQCGDAECEILERIVTKTQNKGNEERLGWDLFNIPHHCSYLALNVSGKKGEKKTEPLSKVKELLESGNAGSYIVSSSLPIPDTDEAYERNQPPHIQARKTYENALTQINGTKFLVTMEQPNTSSPKPIEFKVSSEGLCRVDISSASKKMTAAAILTNSYAPRAGQYCD